MGKVDYDISFLAKLLFVFLLVMVISLMIIRTGNYHGSTITIEFMRYLVLLSYVIPVSLRVNLDFAKLYYSLRINKDKQIENTVSRNSAIPEELGRV